MLVCKKLLCYVRAFWWLFVLVFPFLFVSYINIYSCVSLGDVSYVKLTLAFFFLDWPDFEWVLFSSYFFHFGFYSHFYDFFIQLKSK